MKFVRSPITGKEQRLPFAPGWTGGRPADPAKTPAVSAPAAAPTVQVPPIPVAEDSPVNVRKDNLILPEKIVSTLRTIRQDLDAAQSATATESTPALPIAAPTPEPSPTPPPPAITRERLAALALPLEKNLRVRFEELQGKLAEQSKSWSVPSTVIAEHRTQDMERHFKDAQSQWTTRIASLEQTLQGEQSRWTQELGRKDETIEKLAASLDEMQNHLKTLQDGRAAAIAPVVATPLEAPSIAPEKPATSLQSDSPDLSEPPPFSEEELFQADLLSEPARPPTIFRRLWNYLNGTAFVVPVSGKPKD